MHKLWADGHLREQCSARVTLGCNLNLPTRVLLHISRGNVAVMIRQQQQPPPPVHVGSQQSFYQASMSTAISQPQRPAQFLVHQYPAPSSTTALTYSANWHGGFTARLALSGKRAQQRSVLSYPPDREVWIADSGASFHVTCYSMLSIGLRCLGKKAGRQRGFSSR